MNVLALILKGAVLCSTSITGAPPPASAVISQEVFDDESWLQNDEWKGHVKTVIDETSRNFKNDDHYALNFDDINAELWIRVTKCDKLNSMYPARRAEFFRYAKTVVNNRARTLVQQHLMTRKRAGDFQVNGKMTHVTLDDPECASRIEFSTADSSDSVLPEGWLDDIATLSPVERMVLRQVTEPSETSLMLAQHLTRSSRRSVEVKNEHHAMALGMSLEEFLRVLQGTRTKIMAYKNADEDVEYNKALATLEDAFKIHVPQHLERSVVKRLLTLAARDNYRVLTDAPELAAAMRVIGARMPESMGGTLRCYGVLYHPKERSCAACGLRVACATEAANIGLGKISLSSSLVGVSSRVPQIVPRADANTPAFSSARDELVWAWLSEHLTCTTTRSEFTFKADGKHALFVVDMQGHVCFVDPASTDGLSEREGRWYLPDAVTLDDAIELINSHVTATYAA